MISLSLNIMRVGVNWKRLIASFHQTNLTEILARYKHIKWLHRSSFIELFYKNKLEKRDSNRILIRKKSTISNAAFEIVNEYFGTNNCLQPQIIKQTFKRNKSQNKLWGYIKIFIFQNYKY